MRAGVALTAAALAVTAGSGCGSGNNGPTNTADPATVVPAGVPVFLGADVRPSGAEKDGAIAAGRSLTGQRDPYLRLLSVLRTPGSGQLDYDRDVAPWLGARAGIFLTSLASATALEPIARAALLGSSNDAAFPFATKGAQGALVLDADDPDEARSFLNAQAARAGARPANYRGVAYELTPSGIAFGVVRSFAVLGSDSGLRAVVDTVLGGPSLAKAPGYSGLVDAAPDGALAHLYVDPAVAERPAGAGGTGLLSLLVGSRETNLSLVAAKGSLSLYADSRVAAGTTTPGGLLASGVEGAHALEELPGDSWLAIGFAHLGASLSKNPAGLRDLVSLATGAGTQNAGTGNGVINLNEVLEGLVAPLGELAADRAAVRELTSWMGNGGVFASGTGLLELKAGLVIESNDPAQSRATVARLGTLFERAGNSVERTTLPHTDAAIGIKVNGLPVVLYLANGRDAAGHTKLVLGLGEESISAALAPASTMASASATSTAASALGEGSRPSVIIDTRTLVALLEGIGFSEDPTYAPLVRNLRAITSIVGGGHPLGDGIERFKLLVQLH